MTTWDLTDSRDIARIGWRPSDTEDTYLQRHDDLTVRLPDGVTIDVAEIGGPARVSALRFTSPGSDHRILRAMILEFPRTTVDGAAEMARELAVEYEMPDRERFRIWAMDDPKFGEPDNSAFTHRELVEGELGFEVVTRVRSGDDGVVLLSLSWADPELADRPTTTGMPQIVCDSDGCREAPPPTL